MPSSNRVAPASCRLSRELALSLPKGRPALAAAKPLSLGAPFLPPVARKPALRLSKGGDFVANFVTTGTALA